MTLPAKLTVASTFPIQPATGGGQLRIFHLYRHLAARIPVDVIVLALADEPAVDRELAPGLREVRIPRSAEHAAAEAELEAAAGIPIGDIAFTELHSLTPAFAEAVSASAVSGGALVASHPYGSPVLRAAGVDAPFWYDAHNVEYDLKAGMLPDAPSRRHLLEQTRRVERQCCKHASVVLAASVEDAQRLRGLYRLRGERVVVVPNGVDSAAIRFVPPAERQQLRLRLRMRRPLALFIGSWHEPNVAAARRVTELAREMPEIDFVVAGSVGVPLRDLERPENLQFFGVISEALKRSLLSVASIALNPMAGGSGTNMKMLDYLAAGVPVVSTAVGARGLELGNGQHVRIAALDGFPDAVRSLLAESPETGEPHLQAARRHVEERFDWAAVSRRLLDALEPQAPALATVGASSRSATIA